MTAFEGSAQRLQADIRGRTVARVQPELYASRGSNVSLSAPLLSMTLFSTVTFASPPIQPSAPPAFLTLALM